MLIKRGPSWHFQMHFREKTYVFWFKCQWYMVFDATGTIENNSALLRVMAWRRASDKPLPEPKIPQLSDVIWRHFDLDLQAYLPIMIVTQILCRNGHIAGHGWSTFSFKDLPLKLFCGWYIFVRPMECQSLLIGGIVSISGLIVIESGTAQSRMLTQVIVVRKASLPFYQKPSAVTIVKQRTLYISFKVSRCSSNDYRVNMLGTFRNVCNNKKQTTCRMYREHGVTTFGRIMLEIKGIYYLYKSGIAPLFIQCHMGPLY